jgi:hypothetical protein
MARHRTRVRISRSLRAVVVGLAAAGGVTALFEADLGRGILLSSTTVALLPPALYIVLSFVLLRGVPISRRLGWAVAACGINAVLAVASGLTLSLVHPMSFEGAMRRALWAYAPGPLIHLVAAPLVLLAWRSRVVPIRVSVRPTSTATSPSMRTPAPPLAASTPDWDSVLRVSPPSVWSTRPATGVFDREVREIEPAPEPAPPRRTEPAPMPSPPVETEHELVVAPPMVALPSAPSPPRSPAPTIVTPPPVTMPAPVAPRPVPAPPPAAPRVAPVVPPVVATHSPVADEVPDEPPTADEPMIRIPFDRIADQLPPDVFVLPPERLAESVREPHVIVIPRRLVMPQLGEGAVEVPWTLVDEQFPELALAMPKLEVRRRFPGWLLSLPMDEVVRQIPADVFRVQAPAVDLFDISQFPPPFTPAPPAPAEEEAQAAQGEPPAAAEPTVAVVAAVPEPRVATVRAVAEPVSPPRPEHELPAMVVTAPPAPEPEAPRPLAAAPVPPVPAPVAAPEPPPVAETRAPAAVTDDECETLGRTLALGLSPLGAFDWVARRVGGRPLVSFVPPALPREPIDALAVAAAPMVARLASWGIEQVTVRTTRLVCVLTPLGARGCLAATVRRGGAVAMLELLSTRAGRSAGESSTVASPTIAFAPAATAPASISNGHRAVGDAARALAPFGPFTMSLAEAEGTAPSVYVFGGRDQAVLAGAARVVHEALVGRHDQEGLGRLESVALRRGRERAILRPLRVHGGQPAVLAAAGEVDLAGQAHRAVAQAAAFLEAR